MAEFTVKDELNSESGASVSEQINGFINKSDDTKQHGCVSLQNVAIVHLTSNIVAQIESSFQEKKHDTNLDDCVGHPVEKCVVDDSQSLEQIPINVFENNVAAVANTDATEMEANVYIIPKTTIDDQHEAQSASAATDFNAETVKVEASLSINQKNEDNNSKSYESKDLSESAEINECVCDNGNELANNAIRILENITNEDEPEVAQIYTNDCIMPERTLDKEHKDYGVQAVVIPMLEFNTEKMDVPLPIVHTNMNCDLDNNANDDLAGCENILVSNSDISSCPENEEVSNELDVKTFEPDFPQCSAMDDDHLIHKELEVCEVEDIHDEDEQVAVIGDKKNDGGNSCKLLESEIIEEHREYQGLSRVPGLTYLLRIKNKKEPDIIDCLLCSHKAEGKEVIIHLTSRDHLLQVLEIEDYNLYSKYKEDYSVSSAQLARMAINVAPNLPVQRINTVTSSNYDQVKGALMTGVRKLRYTASTRFLSARNKTFNKSRQKMTQKSNERKFDRIAVVGSSLYRSFLKDLFREGFVDVFIIDELKCDDISSFIQNMEGKLPTSTLWLSFIGVHSVANVAKFQSCTSLNCSVPLNEIALLEDFSKTSPENQIQKTSSCVKVTIEQIRQCINVNSDFTFMPPIPLEVLIIDEIEHQCLHDLQLNYPNSFCASKEQYNVIQDIYTSFYNDITRAALASIPYAPNSDPVLLYEELQQEPVQCITQETEVCLFNTWRKNIFKIFSSLLHKEIPSNLMIEDTKKSLKRSKIHFSINPPSKSTSSCKSQLIEQNPGHTNSSVTPIGHVDPSITPKTYNVNMLKGALVIGAPYAKATVNITNKITNDVTANSIIHLVKLAIDMKTGPIRPLFDKVYIIGESNLVALLDIKKYDVDVTYINYDLRHAMLTDAKKIKGKIVAIPNMSTACFLAFDLTAITVKAKKHRIKCSKINCKTDIPLLNVETQSVCFAEHIYSRIENIKLLVNELSKVMPTFILPLCPSVVFCCPEDSVINYELAHKHSMPRILLTFGHNVFWKECFLYLKNAWNDLLLINHAEYEASNNIIDRYVSENREIHIFGSSYKDSCALLNEERLWKVYIETIFKALVRPASSNKRANIPSRVSVRTAARNDRINSPVTEYLPAMGEDPITVPPPVFEHIPATDMPVATPPFVSHHMPTTEFPLPLHSHMSHPYISTPMSSLQNVYYPANDPVLAPSEPFHKPPVEFINNEQPREEPQISWVRDPSEASVDPNSKVANREPKSRSRSRQRSPYWRSRFKSRSRSRSTTSHQRKRSRSRSCSRGKKCGSRLRDTRSRRMERSRSRSRRKGRSSCEKDAVYTNIRNSRSSSDRRKNTRSRSRSKHSSRRNKKSRSRHKRKVKSKSRHRSRSSRSRSPQESSLLLEMLNRPPTPSPLERIISDLLEREPSPIRPEHTSSSVTLPNDSSIWSSHMREMELALREQVDSDFKVFEEVPEIYEEFEEYYQIFAEKYAIDFPTLDNENHKEAYWKEYWIVALQDIKIKEQQKRLEEFRANVDEHQPKSVPKSHSMPKPLSSKTEDEFSVAKTLDLLEHLQDKFGIFGSTIVAIVNSCKSNGTDTPEALSTINDPQIKILKMAVDKLKLCPEFHSSITKTFYTTAVSWIEKLLSLAQRQKMHLDTRLIARQTLGKDSNHTLDIIRQALSYQGEMNPSQEQLSSLFLEVCSWQFKMSVSSA